MFDVASCMRMIEPGCVRVHTWSAVTAAGVSGNLPIVGVDVPPDDVSPMRPTRRASCGVSQPHGGRYRGAVCRSRGDEVLRQTDVSVRPHGGRLPGAVVHRVVADDMAFAIGASHDLRMPLDHLAHAEERRMHVQLGRASSIQPVHGVLGPSSNVSATFRSERGPLSTTGPKK